MGDLTPHFSRSELVCRCGCGRMRYGRAALNRLEDLRMAFGRPIFVTSGYRCPEYNAEVSATGSKGPHTRYDGEEIAVDVLVYGFPAFFLIQLALDRGWSGLGVAQKGPRGSRFLHLDRCPHADDRPRPWVWNY